MQEKDFYWKYEGIEKLWVFKQKGREKREYDWFMRLCIHQFEVQAKWDQTKTVSVFCFAN